MKVGYHLFLVTILCFSGLGIPLSETNAAQGTTIQLNDVSNLNYTIVQDTPFVFSRVMGYLFDDDYGSTMTVDSQGNTIIGLSVDRDFPLINSYNDTFGGSRDIYLAKFSPSGTILWSTYFGGSNYDTISSITTDSSDDIIFTGQTSSSNYPQTEGTVDDGHPNYGSEIVITKFDSNGTMIWSTFFGSGNNDYADIVITDATNNIYIVGRTVSDYLFPYIDDLGKSVAGQYDIYTIKLDPEGTTILWGDLIGGSSYDGKYWQDIQNFGAAIDSQSNLIIGGYTSSDDFPLTYPYDSTYSGSEGFIIKYKADGNVSWATYIGGNRADEINDIAIDSNDNIIFVGTTSSVDLAKGDPYDDDYASGLFGDEYDGFLGMMSPDGAKVYITYVGAYDSYEYLYEVEVDADDNIIIGGEGNIDYANDEGWLLDPPGGEDGIVLKYSNNGSLMWYTHLGGDLDGGVWGEIVLNLAIGPSGSIHTSGYTFSEDFPLTDTLILPYNNGSYAYLCSFLDPLLDPDGDQLPNNLELEYGFDIYTAGEQDDDLDEDGLDNLAEYNLGTDLNASDTDMDGIDDLYEHDNQLDPNNSSDALLDRDNDTLPNLWEYQYNLNISDATDAAEDTDSDDLTNLQEFDAGTEPDNNDTDSDGMPDGWEVTYGLDPLDDDASGDEDGDGYSNLEEYHNGTDPTVKDVTETTTGDDTTTEDTTTKGTSTTENQESTPEQSTSDTSSLDTELPYYTASLSLVIIEWVRRRSRKEQ